MQSVCWKTSVWNATTSWWNAFFGHWRFWVVERTHKVTKAATARFLEYNEILHNSKFCICSKLPRLSQRALTEVTLYVKRCLDVLRTGKSSKDCDSRAQLHEHQRPTTEMKLTKKKITQLFTYERRRLTIRTLSESRSMCTVYEKLKLKIEWVNV